MEYYNQLLKKIDKPEKLIPIASLLAVTGISAYALKKAFAVKSIDFESKGAERIPIPPGAVYYLGHIPALGEMAAHTVTKWHRQYGPILHIKMGVQDWVYISDPEVGQEVFATQGALSSGRPYLVFGNGISGEGERGLAFTDYGKRWKNARSAVLNIISPKSVQGFDAILQREAERSVNQLIEQSKLHGSVNPLNFVRCSSLNVILATGFGMEGMKSPEDPLFKELEYAIETGLFYASPVGDISAYLPVLSFLDVIFRKERKMRDFFNNVSHPLYNRLVKYARESDQDNLVKKFDLIKEEHDIDDRNISVIMSEVIVAGGDTVAISTSWTYSILCHHPEVQKKLAEEVDAFIRKHNRIPTFEDRLELPYYIAVQKECIRYRPPVYFSIPRKASEDIVYKNYVIPKGVTMVSNIHTLNTDPKIYPEPEKFKPERFFHDTRTLYAGANGNVHNRDLFVFGWGRRICPGIYMAENELFNSITRVMARCTIEPDVDPQGNLVYPDLDDFKDGGATLLPAPFKVRFVERKDRIIL